MSYDTKQTVVAVKVQESDSGWSIEGDGIGFFIKRSLIDSSLMPEKIAEGDEIVLYSRQGSYTVGADLNGRRLYLMSDEEWEAQKALDVARIARQRRERFEHERPGLDADYEALPDVFKRRIDRFRQNNPDFRHEYEGYEMFCCKQAVVFAERAKQAVESGEYADEVNAFWTDETKLKDAAYPNDEPWEEPENPYLRWLFWWSAQNSKAFEYSYERMYEIMPGHSSDHSGNTFGAALLLARLYIESPEFVEKMHGALSPLVGSAAYGDVPREEA